MAQWVKVIAAKCDDLSWLPGTYMMEGVEVTGDCELPGLVVGS